MLDNLFKKLLLLLLFGLLSMPLYGQMPQRRKVKVFSLHKAGGFLTLAPITKLIVTSLTSSSQPSSTAFSASLNAPGLYYEWIPYIHLGFGLSGSYSIRSFQSDVVSSAVSFVEQILNVNAYGTFYFSSYKRAVGFKPFISLILSDTTLHSAYQTYSSQKTVTGGSPVYSELKAGKGNITFSTLSYSGELGTDWVNRKAGVSLAIGYQIIPAKEKTTDEYKLSYKYSNIYAKLSVFTVF